MSETDDKPAFERIENPYVIGNPIRKGEPFFGRESDFEMAARRLEAEKEGIVLLFVGGRRSGKTSIMFQILDGRLGPEYLPVFIDMQQLAGIDGDQEMLGRMARIVIDHINDERLVADYYDFSEGNPILIFDRLLADINQMFPERRLLFLVDEAELLRDKADRDEISSNVITYFASALENRRVSFFFTGSAGLADADIAEWKRLMGKGDFSEISFLTPEDTQRLATEPLDDRVRYADGVLTSLYHLTHGQPFYTQLICTNAVDHLNSNRRYDMSVEDLEEVVHTIVNNPPPQLVYDWEQFTHDEQLALSLLSEATQEPHVPVPVEDLLAAIEENEYPVNMTSADLNVILDALDARMVLERTADAGFHFRVDLVRQWIRRNRSVWRLVEEEGPGTEARSKWVLPVAILVGVCALGAAVMLGRGSAEPETAAVPAPPSLGQVWIDDFPAGAQVHVTGPLEVAEESRSVATGEPRSLIDRREPGTYVATVTHPLYSVWSDTLQVAAGLRDTVAGQLLRLTGRLVVIAAQPDARISIRNEAEGVDTSAVGRLVSVPLNTNTYDIEVTRAGFMPNNSQVVVTAGALDTLRPNLSADVGTLVVVSEPPGASVLMAGRNMGVTPLEMPNLPTGTQSVTVELATYQPQTVSGRVRFGQTVTVEAVLVHEPAQLALSSSPPGASIWLNGELLDNRFTPEVLHRPPGTYNVRLVLDGYDAHEAEVTLTPAGQHGLEPTLAQQFGYVKIVRPQFGTLIINGERGKKGPLRFRKLPVGTWTLALEEERYPGVHEISITKDDTVTVKWE